MGQGNGWPQQATPIPAVNERWDLPPAYMARCSGLVGPPAGMQELEYGNRNY
ncbi:hypothetical protein RIB2604_01503150 [Aspergillus luchuensis]|uniref:Uncharacterized protein n=1 Tax=Aspergillus kawachii TaxID=1069201 RepID=A0A146F952_ASPKA|nr:hypothetical protein RIB2604_01503150 [Aspergillus luchuensis]